MANEVTPAEASAALATIERSRERVIDEIDMPRWYWHGLALGWVALGAVADLGNPLLLLVATVVFGAAHAAASQLVIGGRQRSDALRVRADVVGWRSSFIVVLFLMGLTVVTVLGSIAASVDGARHPVTTVSIVVAVVVLAYGPRVMDGIREHARRSTLTS
ncbi:MAG: hypothetical protein ABWZ99_05735 [Ilumatobacteraceae bacterium]